MTALGDQLARFAAIVTGAEGDASSLIVGDARTRMGVYVHAYIARITQAIVRDYPKLAASIAVEPLVGPYLAAFPSRHPSLREVGARLAEFLAALGQPAHLVDLARLERARVEAFDGGRDVVPLGRDDLAAIGLEAFPTLRLALVPSAQLIELASNADAFWDALESEQPAPPPVGGRATVLVWRRGTTVVHRTLEPDEAPAVRLLAGGTTFARTCEALVDAADPGARAVELLVRWLDAGAIYNDVPVDGPA